jgi:hypothetical protein
MGGLEVLVVASMTAARATTTAIAAGTIEGVKGSQGPILLEQ